MTYINISLNNYLITAKVTTNSCESSKFIHTILLQKNHQIKEISKIVKKIPLDKLIKFFPEKYAFVYALVLTGVTISDVDRIFRKVVCCIISQWYTYKKYDCINKENVFKIIKELDRENLLSRRTNNCLVKIIICFLPKQSAIYKLTNFSQRDAIFLVSKLENMINFNLQGKNKVHLLGDLRNKFMKLTEKCTFLDFFNSYTEIIQAVIHELKPKPSQNMIFQIRSLLLSVWFLCLMSDIAMQLVDLNGIDHELKNDYELLKELRSKNIISGNQSDASKIAENINFTSKILIKIFSKYNNNKNAILDTSFFKESKSFECVSFNKFKDKNDLFNLQKQVEIEFSQLLYETDLMKNLIFTNSNISIDILPDELKYIFQVLGLKNISLYIKTSYGLNFYKDFCESDEIFKLFKDKKVRKILKIPDHSNEVYDKNHPNYDMFIRNLEIFLENISVLCKLLNSKMTKDQIYELYRCIEHPSEWKNSEIIKKIFKEI